jgi:chorismate mutase
MTRIGRLFENLKRNNRKGLIAYLTVGDPSLDRTPALVEALVRGGADLIELGVPFSDPIADGPVIQAAGERALKAGATLKRVLEVAAEIRQQSEVPLLLFTYLNPVLRYGLERLAEDAAAAGIDGCLLTDASVEEAGEYVAAHQHGAASQAGGAIFHRLRVPGLAHRRDRRTRFALECRGPAGRRRSRGHRSAAGGRFRNLQTGTRGGVGTAGGSGGGGQRHRAPDRAQRRKCVARDPARIVRPRIETRFWSAGMTREEANVRLDECRMLIDDVDRRIVALLNERTQVVEEIGRVKRASDLPIYEPKREEQVFANVTRSNQGPMSGDALRRIFERIIDEMRKIQRVRMEAGGNK